jgi:D-lactate dehydrogenase
MDITVFSAKPYDRRFLDAAIAGRHDLNYVEAPLMAETAVLASGSRAVCIFINDVADAYVLQHLKSLGVEMVALRASGCNNVDLHAAALRDMVVARVPAYPPEAVAEHTLGLILSLARNIHRAYARVRDGNFELDGLLGFSLSGKTVGVVGTGSIGACVARSLISLGCKVLAVDLHRDPVCVAMGVEYVHLDRLLAASDIVTLHCPLTSATHHLIGSAAIGKMKHGVMLINTSRGGLVDTKALIKGIKSGAIGHLGLDVYEEEDALFFKDRSDAVVADDVFERLLTFPNVLVTAHQAFFTTEAMKSIAETTAANFDSFQNTGRVLHEARP